MTIIKTFKISSNPQSAIAQCEAALFDMGCSANIIHGANSITIASNEAIKNSQTGKMSKIGFKLILKK